MLYISVRGPLVPAAHITYPYLLGKVWPIILANAAVPLLGLAESAALLVDSFASQTYSPDSRTFAEEGDYRLPGSIIARVGTVADRLVWPDLTRH